MRARSCPAPRRKRRSATQRDDVEVGPPERAGDDQPEHRGDDHAARRARPSTPGADRDDRLAEGDDHDQPEALGEVAGRDAEAAHAEHVRARRSRSRAPRARARPGRRRPRSPAHDQERGAGSAVRREAHDRLAGVDVVVGLGEDEDVQPAHDGVGERRRARRRRRTRAARPARRRASPPSRRTSAAARRPRSASMSLVSQA